MGQGCKELHTWIDTRLMAQMDLATYSEFEKKVPRGAYKHFIESRLREYFLWKKLDLVQYGFPAETFVVGPPEYIELLKKRLKV